MIEPNMTDSKNVKMPTCCDGNTFLLVTKLFIFYVHVLYIIQEFQETLNTIHVMIRIFFPLIKFLLAA